MFLAAAMLAGSVSASAHESEDDQRLPAIGPAPSFELISQDGHTVTLDNFRGKVLAVTFIFASCADTCPLLTDKMARVQEALGSEFGRTVAFASITVDPEHDTPAVLKSYAEDYGARLDGWSFLTGSPEAIRQVTRQYGIFASRSDGGDIDHTFLTSLIDASGILRVQYLGVRFDPEEFQHDLLSLVDEAQ